MRAVVSEFDDSAKIHKLSNYLNVEKRWKVLKDMGEKDGRISRRVDELCTIYMNQTHKSMNLTDVINKCSKFPEPPGAASNSTSSSGKSVVAATTVPVVKTSNTNILEYLENMHKEIKIEAAANSETLKAELKTHTEGRGGH